MSMSYDIVLEGCGCAAEDVVLINIRGIVDSLFGTAGRSLHHLEGK
jgi:hypothetical protein